MILIRCAGKPGRYDVRDFRLRPPGARHDHPERIRRDLSRHGWIHQFGPCHSNTLNVLAGLLIPAVIITSPGLGGALPMAIWYGVLTAATIALALAGRGINRRSGAVIIAAYLVFAITLVATAVRP